MISAMLGSFRRVLDGSRPLVVVLAVYRRATVLSIGAQLAGFALLALVPVVLLGLIWATSQRAQVLDETEASLKSRVAGLAVARGGITDAVGPVLDVLGLLSKIKALDPVCCLDVLIALREDLSQYSGFVLADVTGRVVCNSRRFSTTTLRGDRLDFPPQPPDG